MHKTCPTCRKRSDYILSSKIFLEHGTPGKEAEIKRYLDRVATIPCRYFTQSYPYSPFCPFANDCHYSHNANGRRYIFNQRELQRIRQRKERNTHRRHTEAMLSELMSQEQVLALDDHEAFILDILQGFLGYDDGRFWDDSSYGEASLPWWTLGDEFDNSQDNEDEVSDDSDNDDDLPSLVSGDSIPDLIDDDDVNSLPFFNDDPCDLTDTGEDDIPPLLDDDLPHLIDSDSIPELLDETLSTSSRMGEDWDLEEFAHHPPQEHALGATGTGVLMTDISSVLDRSQQHPQESRIYVSYSPFSTSNQSALPSTASTHLYPRRFSPPQHTPPPGRRRPRPPHSRNQDTSRTRTPLCLGVSRLPPPDELDPWEDDSTETTADDGELSEREKQRNKEREERGINGRNWESRVSDLSSYFA